MQQVKVMTRDVIDAVPTGKTFQNIGVLVPGVTVAAGGTGATPYNVFNRSPVLAYNNAYGPEWLRLTDVLQGRLVKIGGQFTF